MKIKIGVLSDTHLYRVTKDMEAIYREHLSDLDVIFHAGDFVCREVVDFLGKGPFHGVHGNMDPDDVRRLIPGKKVIEIGAFRFGLIHGWGSSEGLEERISSEFRDVDAVVYGHSHRPANHLKDGLLFFNPGTAVGYSSSGNNTIGVLEVGDTVKGDIIRI